MLRLELEAVARVSILVTISDSAAALPQTLDALAAASRCAGGSLLGGEGEGGGGERGTGIGFLKNAGMPLQWSGAWEVSLRTPDSRRERSDKILNSSTQSPKSPTLTDSVSEHSLVRLY